MAEQTKKYKTKCLIQLATYHNPSKNLFSKIYPFENLNPIEQIYIKNAFYQQI